MYTYNATYKNLANNWRNANETQKHTQVKQMFLTIATTKDQEVEFATLDFMDRWVYGSNLSLDYSSLKCERGFSHYNVNKTNTPKRRKLNITVEGIEKAEKEFYETQKLIKRR